MTPLEEVIALQATASSASQYRTVMSRAYYATFRTLMAVAGPLGFASNDRERSVHSRLRMFLRDSPTPVLKRIARVVRLLFDLRVRADYQFELPVRAVDSAQAVQLATDIHDWIQDARLTSAF